MAARSIALLPRDIVLMAARTAASARTLRCCARCCSLAATVVAVPARAGRGRRCLALARRQRRAKQNYVGTIVYQHGGRFETSRLVHLNDRGSEFEKLVNLEGPAREVIRMNGEVRCYYPDAKVIRIEPRTFRNALSVALCAAAGRADRLLQFPDGRGAGASRASKPRPGYSSPKDGLRYGHKFWADAESGLLVKARIVDERERGRRAVRVHRDSDRREDRPRAGEIRRGR